MEAITDWLTAPVYFPGTRWRIVFTHRVLLACQELTGIDMLAETMGSPSAALLRALLYLALARAGAGLSIEDVGRRLGRNMAQARSTVVSAWAASMPDPEQPEQKGKQAKKKEPKKLTWPDVWAAARLELRLMDEEWLAMTPRMAKALASNRLETVRQREFLASRAIAMGANFSFCAPKQAFRHDQFMINPWPEGEQSEQITGEYIMDALAAARRKG